MLSLKKFEEKNYSGNQIGSKLVHKVVSRNSTKLLQKQFISEASVGFIPAAEVFSLVAGCVCKALPCFSTFFNDFFSHVATVSTFI